MIKEADYIRLVGELLNQDPNPRDRETRVRNANRELYRAVVSNVGGAAQADLALAKAALRKGNHAKS